MLKNKNLRTYKNYERTIYQDKQMVEIKEVKTKKDLRKFAGFNEKMYRNVPQAMPDLISDEMANFNPKKNPAYSYAEL